MRYRRTRRGENACARVLVYMCLRLEHINGYHIVVAFRLLGFRSEVLIIFAVLGASFCPHYVYFTTWAGTPEAPCS
jgi:hypothetical protein